MLNVNLEHRRLEYERQRADAHQAELERNNHDYDSTWTDSNHDPYGDDYYTTSYQSGPTYNPATGTYDYY